MVSALMGANAQIATENSNVFDNIGLGGTVGVTTPLDFNSMFPINTNFGVRMTKDVTPVIGFQLEGVAFMNGNHFIPSKTAFEAFTLGANGVFNVFNAFGGYKGSPRVFETNVVLGLGWLHTCGPATNDLYTKTGLDLSFNIGKSKAHSIVLTPAIFWNVGDNFKFSRSKAQLGVSIGYIYHFKTSNGTHHFKQWNIGELNDEINYLKGANAQLEKDLDACLNREPQVVEKIVTKTVEKEKVVEEPTAMEWIVQFPQSGSFLTDEAKAILNQIGEDTIVDVVGTASPEGNKAVNQRLSEKRAAVVADYLTKRGVKVNSWCGKGVQIGEATNRLAIVTVHK
jgi:outer membrane protein OmpA-like peptidoglycan-associated protein